MKTLIIWTRMRMITQYRIYIPWIILYNVGDIVKKKLCTRKSIDDYEHELQYIYYDINNNEISREEYQSILDDYYSGMVKGKVYYKWAFDKRTLGEFYAEDILRMSDEEMKDMLTGCYMSWEECIQ